MKIILVSGKAQSGKDTAAGILREELKSNGHNVLITHYADLLKYICKQYLGWNGEKDAAGRELLQYVGTDIVRKQNPTIWVDFIAMILKWFHDNWDYVIIPDCRFPNEITTLIDNGFDAVHLRMVRSAHNGGLSDTQMQHLSETALDDIKPDFYIENNDTLDDLRTTLVAWSKEFL